MPFFVSNFPDKLSIYPKRTTAVPNCLQNWLYSVLCFNQLNDIRVPRAISPRERLMHGALNLENLHYFGGMQLNT